MQIRLDNIMIGISGGDSVDPITGRRVLLINEVDKEGKPTGYSVLVPLDEAQIAHLHSQTSAVATVSEDEARRLLDEAVPASPELELEQKRRSRRLGRRGT